jgi:NAD(P)H-hydrate repair Nnr-like enzyme with NAD(P)H-hydrate dehydratase domain
MVTPNKLQVLELIHRLKREPSEHKGDAGKILLIGGAPGMSGALIGR